MTPLQLTVNGRLVAESIEPRTHLADFIRERLNLTATHLRCEQGACGACTLLIDGQPARSCITYAVLCDGAAVTTLEGLEDDPTIVALRRAFSVEHGLQCGYCTPGMLITARDIVLRLPDADQARIRNELSGNLCRCTGYVGIVRAISRVLDERRNGELAGVAHVDGPLGPVGARAARPLAGPTPAAALAARSETPSTEAVLGLAGRQPNIEIRRSFTVASAPDVVWAFFADIAAVVQCLPGASLTSPPDSDPIDARMSVKLGPITANFFGQARIIRDEAAKAGRIIGSGRDQAGGSRAAGEVDYAVQRDGDGTRVDLTIRVLLTGPLAQFSRAGIVEDLAARITDTFARNLETRLSGGAPSATDQAPIKAGALLWQVIMARLRGLFGRPSQ
jgi:carbon-monoxide dehydrogenase small subunit